MSLFENKKDCPIVESFIWECIGFDYSDFAGVKELSFSEYEDFHDFKISFNTDCFKIPKYNSGIKFKTIF